MHNANIIFQLCQWIFQQQYPTSIEATGTLNSDGVDLTMKATLTYSDTSFATIETSAIETLNNQAVIKGSKGEITVSSRRAKKIVTTEFSNEFFVC